MKAYLKKDLYNRMPTQVGIVTKVWVTTNGQKRMEVRFPYSTVDAAVEEFEIV